mmetsp:Transcript_131364/g.319207  ORF Transcript_131364/g.319207 Transcript_131364/m.319207 type:complete len:588 (-) Transcript_131364:37-1800(-)
MAAESADVDLRQWPAHILKTALGHLGVDTAGCVDSESLTARLLPVPMRDVRTALTKLNAYTSDCVERGDLLVRLLESSRAAASDSEDCEPWPPGSVVRLVKLQSAPALNMQRGTIVRYDADVDRYEVRLEWDGSTKKIREENLILEEEAAAVNEEDPRATDEAPMARANPPEHHVCVERTGEAAQVSAETIDLEDEEEAGAENEGPDESHVQSDSEFAPEVPPLGCQTTDQEEAFPAVCPADPAAELEAAGDSSGHMQGLKEPEAVSITGSTAEAAGNEVGAIGVPAPTTDTAREEAGTGQATPEVRRRKRRFKDETQPAAAQSHEVAPAAASKAEEPAAAEAASAASPWVVKAAAKVPEEVLAPPRQAREEATPSKKPTRLRVGYKGGRQPEGPGRMASGLRELFWSGDLCDAALVCGTSTLRAHKAVLAGQSGVFRGLLKDKAEVQLPEISHPEAVRLMLDYLYEVGDESTYSPALHGINCDVLRLAEKFQLPELKQRAAVFMANGVTTENAVERLRLCEDFKLHDLRDRILEQLAVKKKALAEISKSPEIAGYPQLLQEILKRVAGTGCPPQGSPPAKRARKGN